MTNTIASNKATLVTNIAIVPSRLNTFYYRNDPGEKRFLEGNEGKKKKTIGKKKSIFDSQRTFVRSHYHL